mgnify:FL=1
MSNLYNKLVVVSEKPVADIMRKQRSIYRLFPTFDDRVDKVASKGGIRLVGEGKDTWNFTITSATVDGKKYNATLNFNDLDAQIKDKARDKSLWNKDGTKVDFNKLAAAIIDDVDVRIDHPDCPAFLYWGQKYITTQRQTAYQDKENRPPRIRNPKEYGHLCKHLQLLFEQLPFYTSTFSKMLKKYHADAIAQVEGGAKTTQVGVSKAADFLGTRQGGGTTGPSTGPTPAKLPKGPSPDQFISGASKLRQETEPQADNDVKNAAQDKTQTPKDGVKKGVKSATGEPDILSKEEQEERDRMSGEGGIQESICESSGIWYHGSASGDLRGGVNGLHLGTKKAATQALNATIGIPVEGEWDGTREYGKTLLKGKNKLGTYEVTGYNCDAPEEDYYANGKAKYSNREPIPLTVKPEIRAYRIIGKMTNTVNNPYKDFRANGMMKGQLKKGNARSGYFYKNDGEDVGSISAVLPNGSHVQVVEESLDIADAIMLLNESSQITPEMIKHFEDRTNRHINLVRQSIKKIVNKFPEFSKLLDRGKVHDDSKFKEPERTPYIFLTWQNKTDRNGSPTDHPMKIDKGVMQQATLHHITTNSHHPEYWDKLGANVDINNRNNANFIVDATKMPPLDIAEMIADWNAMSEELRTNTPRQWFNKQREVRWHFSQEQEQLIDKLLTTFE